MHQCPVADSDVPVRGHPRARSCRAVRIAQHAPKVVYRVDVVPRRYERHGQTARLCNARCGRQHVGRTPGNRREQRGTGAAQSDQVIPAVASRAQSRAHPAGPAGIGMLVRGGRSAATGDPTRSSRRSSTRPRTGVRMRCASDRRGCRLAAETTGLRRRRVRAFRRSNRRARTRRTDRRPRHPGRRRACPAASARLSSRWSPPRSRVSRDLPRLSDGTRAMTTSASRVDRRGGCEYQFASRSGATPAKKRAWSITFFALRRHQPSRSHRRADVSTGCGE